MAWTVANFVALATVFGFLAVTSVFLRFWTRKFSKTRFGVDDALIIPAALGVVGIAVTMIVGTAIGDMAQHQTNVIGPHGPVFTVVLANYEKCNYILQILPLISLGLSKTSVLFFYRRIFHVHPRFLVVNTVLIVLVAAWATAFLFATIFQCKTPATLWHSFEYARIGCVQTLPFYYAVSISGFITDLLILVSPLPLIHTLQMPLKSRIAVSCILLLGAVVVGAGVARFVTFINVGRGIFANINDLTYFTTPVFAWTMIESSLAVVGANLPLLRPLLHRKTYTSSQAWSLLRSIRPRRTFRDINDEQISLESASKDSLQYTTQNLGSLRNVDPSLHPKQVAEAVKQEQSNTPERGIHVQKEFELV
ncbi:hypothetical protein F5B22DRAFT_655869 [Xylaria bambusicola]|uniref:uncharacterized protein n=1 Tax=Xylaria bambusicola TaxID=326684 RepID=UPI0020077730|nr:uncharacterized protein F5B22DRAFT_655869 [Xylaria bambusicola]KAI0516711.1 hypothetical protein F5B22DRAFT_655869 [Xylaria bambusicola]